MNIVRRWKVNLACLNSILQKKLAFAAWHVTYRCNLRCSFCEFHRRRDVNEMTPAEIGRAFERLRRLGVGIVNFAGGEPYLRNDFPEIIHAVAGAANVIVNSNGGLINRMSARRSWAAGMDVINISIDFADPHKHDLYRGKPGTWKKAWDAVEVLLAERTNSRQTVTVQSIYSRENCGELERLVQLSEKAGAKFATNPYCAPDNSALDWKFPNKGLEMTDRGQHEATLLLAHLKRSYPSTFLISDYAIEKTDEYIKRGCVTDCCAGKYMLAVSPSGEIMPCERTMEHRVGNILDHDVLDIGKKLSLAAREMRCTPCYARERSELEYIYQPLSLETFRHLLAEAKA